MITHHNRYQGNVLSQLLVATLLAGVGAYLALGLSEITEVTHLRENLKFATALFGLFLVPSWAQFKELQELMDRTELSVREQREIDHLTKTGKKRALLRAGFFLLGATVTALSPLLPNEPTFNAVLLPIVGAFLLLSFYFVMTLLLNIWEINQFKSTLAIRRTTKAASKDLLAQYKDSKK